MDQREGRMLKAVKIYGSQGILIDRGRRTGHCKIIGGRGGCFHSGVWLKTRETSGHIFLILNYVSLLLLQRQEGCDRRG